MKIEKTKKKGREIETMGSKKKKERNINLYF